VVGVAAAATGARHATGCDLDQSAVFVGARNAAANAVRVDFQCHDVIDYCSQPQFDLILVADLFYQREFAAELWAALTAAHRRGCAIIIADSGRPFLPKENLTAIHDQSVATSFAVEGRQSRTVRLYRLSFGASAHPGL
jgi:predicted nicotinamide N-methyase